MTGRLEPGHPLTLEAKCPAGLGPGRDRQEDATLERADGHLAAEQRLLEGEREVPLEVGAATGEPRIGRPLDDDDQVAAARAPAGELDPGPRVGTRRDGDLETLAVDVA